MWLDPARWVISTMFGVRWVVLVDHDGSERIRAARLRRGAWVAERMGGLIGRGIRQVELLPNGNLRNGSYVVSWRPYAPFDGLSGWPRPPFPSHAGETH